MSEKRTAMQTQVGGDHYTRMKIQPMTFSEENHLTAAQHTAIKYVARFLNKDGVKDLEKARHTIDWMLDFYYPDRDKNAPRAAPSTEEMLQRKIDGLEMTINEKDEEIESLNMAISSQTKFLSQLRDSNPAQFDYIRDRMAEDKRKAGTLTQPPGAE